MLQLMSNSAKVILPNDFAKLKKKQALRKKPAAMKGKKKTKAQKKAVEKAATTKKTPATPKKAPKKAPEKIAKKKKTPAKKSISMKTKKATPAKPEEFSEVDLASLKDVDALVRASTSIQNRISYFYIKPENQHFLFLFFIFT